MGSRSHLSALVKRFQGGPSLPPSLANLTANDVAPAWRSSEGRPRGGLASLALDPLAPPLRLPLGGFGPRSPEKRRRRVSGVRRRR